MEWIDSIFMHRMLSIKNICWDSWPLQSTDCKASYFFIQGHDLATPSYNYGNFEEENLKYMERSLT